MPTTVHWRCAKRRLSPRPAAREAAGDAAARDDLRGSRLEHAAFDDVHLRRIWKPAAVVPRTTMFDGLSGSFGLLLRFGMLMTATGSLEISFAPSPSVAISGLLSITCAWSRPTPLCTSDAEALRITITLSGCPVATSVARMPSVIISTLAKTNTTSAMPLAVSSVVTLRA